MNRLTRYDQAQARYGRIWPNNRAFLSKYKSSDEPLCPKALFYLFCPSWWTDCSSCFLYLIHPVQSWDKTIWKSPPPWKWIDGLQKPNINSFSLPLPSPSGSGKRLWSERFEGYWVFQLNAALWSHASSRAGTVLLWIYKGHLISTRLEDATSQNTKRNANSVATPSPVFSYSWTYACCIRCPKALSWWMITHFHVPIRHRCTSFSSCYRVVVFLLRKFRNNFIFSFPSSTSPDCLNGSYLFVWSLNQFLLCCCLVVVLEGLFSLQIDSIGIVITPPSLFIYHACGIVNTLMFSENDSMRWIKTYRDCRLILFTTIFKISPSK